MSQSDWLLHRLVVETPRRIVRLVKRSPLVLFVVPTLSLICLLAYAKSERIPLDVLDSSLLIGAPLLLSIAAIPLIFFGVALAFVGVLALGSFVNRRVDKSKDALLEVRSSEQRERRVAVASPVLLLALATFLAMESDPVVAGLLRAFGIGGGYIATFDVAGTVSDELVAPGPDGNEIVSTVPVRVLLMTGNKVLVRPACEAETTSVLIMPSDAIRKRTLAASVKCHSAGPTRSEESRTDAGRQRTVGRRAVSRESGEHSGAVTRRADPVPRACLEDRRVFPTRIDSGTEASTAPGPDVL